jgi:hypothetical protein
LRQIYYFRRLAGETILVTAAIAGLTCWVAKHTFEFCLIVVKAGGTHLHTKSVLILVSRSTLGAYVYTFAFKTVLKLKIFW